MIDEYEFLGKKTYKFLWFGITVYTWKDWYKFVNKRLDDLSRNAGTNFCNFSERIDNLQHEINDLKKQFEIRK